MAINIFIIFVIGFIIGVIFFFYMENASYSNSFLQKCWKRQQPKWIVHNKVYILSVFIIYKSYEYNDILLMILGSAWLGLHLSQDIAERIHEHKYLDNN